MSEANMTGLAGQKADGIAAFENTLFFWGSARACPGTNS
jgi:hypothetical protein